MIKSKDSLKTQRSSTAVHRNIRDENELSQVSFPRQRAVSLKSRSQQTTYAKDISEHTSSVGRFYADFDEFDLAELAPPSASKQHWWEHNYSPYVEDGHKLKICSLSDVTELSASTKNQGAHVKSQARQGTWNEAESASSGDSENSENMPSGSDFDESLLPPMSSFNPLAYRKRQHHKRSSQDIKSARDLVRQDSYQERLRQYQQQKYGVIEDNSIEGSNSEYTSSVSSATTTSLESQAQLGASNISLATTDKATVQPRHSQEVQEGTFSHHSFLESHYAQEVALHNQVTKSQHADSSENSEKSKGERGTDKALAKPSYAHTVAMLRAQAQELKEQQFEQHAQAAITPWNTRGDQILRAKNVNSAQSRLLKRHGGIATQEGQEHDPFFMQARSVSRVEQEGQSLAVSPVTQERDTTVTFPTTPTTVATPSRSARVVPTQGKVPYRNYFAQQNVFGSSSEEEEQAGRPRRYRTFKSSRGETGSSNNISGSSRWGKRGKVISKKGTQVIDYDDISCGVSGIGMASSSVDSKDAYDIEKSTASFGSFGGQENRASKSSRRSSKGSWGRGGRQTEELRASASRAEISQEHTALYADVNLGAGADTLKSSAATDKAKQSEPVRAYNYMIQLLTRREYSQAEIRQKVKGRFSEEAVEQALQRCVEYGYQSDSRHAEMLIRHMEFSGYGPQKLWLEARRKGADKDEIKRLGAEVDWDDIAYQAVSRKFSAEQVADYTTRNKALAYLARRGFSSSSSYAALERLQKDVENE